MKRASSYFPWRSEYNINVKTMDSQHRELVNIINELQQAINEGEGKERLGQVLEKLLEYTDFHFSAEEKLMKKHGYPGYQEHSIKHTKMRSKVLSLIHDYNSGGVAKTFSVLKFLQDWLIKHIMDTDRNYADYLNRKGIN